MSFVIMQAIIYVPVLTKTERKKRTTSEAVPEHILEKCTFQTRSLICILYYLDSMLSDWEIQGKLQTK
jgi:hypothetical protein